MQPKNFNDADEYIELKFGPQWKYIAAARAFIQNFLVISISDAAKADKIAMAASELLENAVKYSEGNDTRVYVCVFPKTTKVIVAVSNQSDELKVKVLREIFAKVSTNSPLEAYISQMREAAVRNDGKSQLGLARIRYETGANISLDITDKNLVTITIEVD